MSRSPSPTSSIDNDNNVALPPISPPHHRHNLGPLAASRRRAPPRKIMNRSALYAHMYAYHRRRRSPSPEVVQPLPRQAAAPVGPPPLPVVLPPPPPPPAPAPALQGEFGLQMPYQWPAPGPVVGVPGQANGPGEANPNNFPPGWLALGLNGGEADHGGEVDNDGASLHDGYVSSTD